MMLDHFFPELENSRIQDEFESSYEFLGLKFRVRLFKQIGKSPFKYRADVFFDHILIGTIFLPEHVQYIISWPLLEPEPHSLTRQYHIESLIGPNRVSVEAYEPLCNYLLDKAIMWLYINREETE